MKDIEKLCVKITHSIEETVAAIQEGGVGIALVLDEQRRLLGTITDGDIRRAILNRVPLHSTINKLFEYRPSDYPQPTVASIQATHDELRDIMEEKRLRHIPILDHDQCVVDLVVLNELIEEEHHLPVVAVVMAGGKGQRLQPLTEHLPKPMLPLESRPILECIVEQLKKCGIQDIYFSTNYKSEIIANHFGHGESFGVNIKYIHESQPLGTAGSLSLIAPSIDKTTLVINGDILTQLNFRTMFDFHQSHHADMTVGVRIYEIKIPYGVIETDDIYIKKLAEKPMQACIVNAGIYFINPSVYEYIPKGQFFDMTELVERLINDQRRVISFPIQEYWMDVGHHADYEKAKVDFRDFKDGRF